MIKQIRNQKSKNFDLEIKKLLPGLKKNVLLKNYTTFRMGGKVKYFFIAKTREDLIKVLKITKKYNLPFFILGGGSNLLVDDQNYKGIIIKIQNLKYKSNITEGRFQQQQNLKIIVEAGVPLSFIVNESVKNNLTGMEWAIDIPGTIGGAVWGNAGAFGHSISKIVKVVEVFNFKNFKIKKIKQKDCKFQYRDSIFRKNPNLIILSVEIQLKKGNKKTIEKKIKEYLKIRRKKIPFDSSAGSIFKNIEKNNLTKEQLKLIPLKNIKQGKIPAGYLIEQCGLKGKIIGAAKISEKHANFIVNLGKAKFSDVLKLINLIKKKVKQTFNIVLKEEICYWKFN